MKLASPQTLLRLLIVFYGVGVISLLSPLRTYILPLTVYNILLTFIFFLLSLGSGKPKVYIDVLLIGVFGFLAEFIGVNYGYLFGDYKYGSTLGPQYQHVPLIMAVNWILLCFSSSALVSKLGKSDLMKAILSAGLMTLLDIVLEKLAGNLDFWHWNKGVIPTYNYVCWFGLSVIANYWLFKRNSVVRNQLTVGIFVVQLSFFVLLFLFQ